MDSDDPAIEALLDRIDEAPGVRLVAIKVLSTAPLEVSINGAGSVPAYTLDGQSLSLGETGFAIWLEPLKPICFAVT